MNIRVAFSVSLVLSVLSGILLDAHAMELRTIMDGAAAPGFEAGATIDSFPDAPRIDADGNVSVVAIVRRAAGERVQAIYRAAPAVQLLFKAGDSAPGGGGLVFNSFPFFPATPHIDTGRATFVAEVITDPGAMAIEGIWSDRFSGFERLYLAGEPLPQPPPGATDVVGFGMVTRGPTALMRAQFARGSQILSDDQGIYRNSAGAWQRVLAKGQPAPDLAGAVFDGNTPHGTIFFFTARNDGRVLAQAWIAGTGIDANNDEGLWVEGPGGLQLVAREGASVVVTTNTGSRKARSRRATFGPTDSGVPTFGSDNENLVPAINDGGRIVFGAVLRFGKERSGSVWTNRDGALELLALGTLGLVGSGPGTQAPGLPAGANFATFILSRINNSGRIAFQAFASEFGTLQNLTEGIWWDVPGTLQLVAARGRPLAAIPGAAVADILQIDRLTDDGRLFFEARLTGTGIGAANDRAIFVAAPGTGVVPLLREGDTVGTSQGARIVRDYEWSIRGTGTREGVATIVFTDGSLGVFAFPVE